MNSSPGTIVIRATALREQIEELDRRRGVKDRLRDFQQRQQILAGAIGRAASARDCLERFARRGLYASPTPAAEVVAAHAALLRLQRAFSGDPSAVLQAEFKDVYETTLTAVKVLEDRARGAWQDVHRRQTAAWSPEFLAALEKLEPFRPAVRAIRAAQSQLRQLEARFPPTESDLEGFDVATAARERAFAQLKGQRGLPEAVVVFLTQCASGAGFPLADVTPEIQTWLAAEGILPSFRVKL